MKWISCNDSLPTHESHVLATVRTTIDECYIDNVMEVSIVYNFYSGHPVFMKNGITLDDEKHNVLAWMPLPEPYKGECHVD